MNTDTDTTAVKTLLQINSSLNGNAGESTRLANAYVEQWKIKNPQGRLVIRDLSAEPVPHLDGERFSAFITAADERTAKQREVVAFSDVLITELRAAEEVVVGLPMYNFGIPSSLKAWFDHVARAGETFRYTETGPQGLLDNLPVTVLATRGGQYAGTERDSQTRHVTDFFSLLGLTDLNFIYAEGLNMGPEVKASALAAANQEIEANFLPANLRTQAVA